MHTMMIAIAIKLTALTTVPAHCSAPRDIGGGMTVKTCEIVKGGVK